MSDSDIVQTSTDLQFMQHGAGRKHSTGMVSSETIVVVVVGMCSMSAIKMCSGLQMTFANWEKAASLTSSVGSSNSGARDVPFTICPRV